METMRVLGYRHFMPKVLQQMHAHRGKEYLGQRKLSCLLTMNVIQRSTMSYAWSPYGTTVPSYDIFLHFMEV